MKLFWLLVPLALLISCGEDSTSSVKDDGAMSLSSSVATSAGGIASPAWTGASSNGTSSDASTGVGASSAEHASSMAESSSILASSAEGFVPVGSSSNPTSLVTSASSASITINPESCTYAAGTAGNGSLTCTNNTYPIVTIGAQTWMATNLAWLPEVNAESVHSSTVAKYYVYDRAYGVLYNFQAALTACPTGWHLPTNNEWTTLENYVDANNGTKGIGNSLKATSGWPVYDGIVNSDDFGFLAMPGGEHWGSGFYNFGTIGDWWTATEASTTEGYNRSISYGNSLVFSSPESKDIGLSVRCLKDAN